MRVVVYGLGAIGGTVAVAMAEAGIPVQGIARGAQLEAVQASGLRLRTPERDLQAHIPCAASPGDIDFAPDDLILLAMKTQDTAEALAALRAAGVDQQPVFCLQNGVANEPLALRFFPNVHGVTVLMPAMFLTPGEVACFGMPRLGIFDIGRYPTGTDAADAALAERFDAAGMAGYADPAVMDSKYGKLLLNLNNAVKAAFPKEVEAATAPLQAAARAEAEATLAAAGISWRDVGAEDSRRKEMLRFGQVPGLTRVIGSTTQSLMRGTGAVETDYLNGEIVYLGRAHGIPVPVNAYLAALAARMAHQGAPAHSANVEDALGSLGLSASGGANSGLR